MIVAGSVNPLLLGGEGYQISRSVRLRSSASAYLNRTNSGSPTNAIKWTWSGWVKRGSLGAQQNLVGATNSGSDDTYFQFNSSDQILFGSYTGSGTDYGIKTAAVFRDPSAWYHVVAVLDTANATSADRAIVYVNGVRQTVTNQASGMWPQNATNNKINTASQVVNIGRRSLGDSYLDGYLTEINFIDGQALTPSSFGETNAITGVWQPKKYGGTYGTNGFYLNFSDNSGATATTIGKDYSGNGNNWTPNNISVTAGVTYDSMLDVPTPYADGGNGRGNYAVLNPVDLGYSATLSEANLKVSTASSGNAASASTMALSTNTYWEVTIGSNSQVGLIWGRASDAYGNSSISMFANGATGSLGNATRTLSATPSWSNGDTLGFAWNNSTRVLTLYQAGSATAVMTMTTPATGDPNVAITNYTSGAVMSSQVNFGQRPFSYTPPTGFVALNTQNLPAPTISNGASYMAATTYAGSASTQVINSNLTSLNFAWIKDRTSARSHVLVDTVRGGSPMLTLYSELTAAEDNSSPNFNPTSISGSSITLGGAKLGINTSGDNYVMWGWSAGSSNVSNTSGSITSTVSANPTAGFSVVTWSGSGAAGTIGHGLNAVPAMLITKKRTSATDSNWVTWHKNLTGGNTVTDAYYMYLNSTNGQNASGGVFYKGTDITSTTFGFQGGNANVNASGQDYVAYCFAPVAGYSAFGSYTGNGSTDGPFVYTGFRPRWVMIKRTDTSGFDWILQDTSRSTYNAADSVLNPNSSAAEQNGGGYTTDVLSNGFKLRNSGGQTNASGGTYVYACFSESPFKLSLAR